MCGIVGLFLKNPKMRPCLGALLEPMLVEMTERGPDSAGVAIYGEEAPHGGNKYTLFHPDLDYAWDRLAEQLGKATGRAVTQRRHHNHLLIMTLAAPKAVQDWLKAHAPDVHMMGSGRRVEVYKDMGLPKDVAQNFGLAQMPGSHAVGHTRLATESAVTTEHSHPFSAGSDICLVHNGSLSNHNRLRKWLKRHGMEFQTDNDTEVAARYFAYQMSEGASLKEALEAGIRDLDGFYTFAVSTYDGFAVLRDPIACKPAVMAETSDWVAMATEYRAIATLPGADEAQVWEPQPETVYSWTLEEAA